MGVLVQIESPSGERTWGLLVLATVTALEWHVRIDEVPRVATYSYRDVVAAERGSATLASAEPRRFVRVVERGPYRPSLRVTHALTDVTALDRWLEQLEQQGWCAREDDGGVVWLAAPSAVDARSVLARTAWVTAVDAA